MFISTFIPCDRASDVDSEGTVVSAILNERFNVKHIIAEKLFIITFVDQDCGTFKVFVLSCRISIDLSF